MGNRLSRVLVVGDVMTDIIVRPEGGLVIGSDRRASITTLPGGSGANQAIWLGAMGVAVTFVARVGESDVDALSAHFARFGVEALLRPDPHLASGVLISLIGPEGERSFLTDRGANLALSTTDLPVSLLETASLLVLSGYSFFAETPRRAVMALRDAAKEQGVPTLIDPASVGFLEEVGPRAFLDWTSGASLLFANSAEASCLSGTSVVSEQIVVLGRHYERVVIKLGAEGAALGTRDGPLAMLPAPPVEARDTTGAGDAFAAAFIAAELAGAQPVEALGEAILAGTRAVQHIGGQPPSGPPRQRR